MKTSKARLDWREGRRRRAWELKQAGWKQQDIAAALGVTSGAVSQWLARARAQGVEEGLRRHPAPGPRPCAQAHAGTVRPVAGALGSWGGSVRVSRAGLDVQ